MKPTYRSCSSLNSVNRKWHDHPARAYHRWVIYSSVFLIASFIVLAQYFSPSPLFSPPSLFAATNILENVGDVGSGLDMVLDSRGFPVLSYVDKTNGDLKMTHCGNATCTSGNKTATVDSIRTVGGDTSLVLDTSGFPVFAYYDSANGDLRYIRCTDANCTATANAKALLTSGDVGISSDMFRWDNSGSNNGNNFIVVTYDTTNTALSMAMCFGLDCTGLGTGILDDTASVGNYPSIVPLANESELPRISYFDETNGKLKITFCSSFLSSSACNVSATFGIQGSIVGTYSSIALDTSGNPVVSFYNQTNGDLLFIHCSTNNCTDNPTVRTLDNTGDVGAGTSLSLNSKGNPVIAYYDVTNTALKLITCGDANCSRGNRITTPDSANVTGEFPALQLSAPGALLVSYYDRSSGNLLFSNTPNLSPTGLTNFTASALTATTITLNWTAAIDDNFDHYEIWYGTKSVDVLNRRGTALEWDNAPNDPTLGNVTTGTTRITNLASQKKHYFKIWAQDASGNETTLGTIYARTTNSD